MMRVPVLEGHQLWAESYDTAPNPLVALEMRIMLDVLAQRPPARLTDVACGTGRWLVHFQQTGASVVGVDFCDAMLRQAAQHQSLRERLILADVEQLPLRDGSSDLVFCSLALGYFPDLQRGFNELARVCAPGGQIAISDLHPDAMTAGWTRSFKRKGAHYEIDHYVYSWEQIDDAASEAGLRLVLRHSAHLGHQERPLFQKAGKDHLFAAAAAVPALFAAFWERPC
jgi:malonyl-CoA O-methyltransferase